MSKAVEEWLRDGLDEAFPETDEQRAGREAAELFGQCLTAATRPVSAELFEEEAMKASGLDDMPVRSQSPFANLPLNWSVDGWVQL